MAYRYDSDLKFLKRLSSNDLKDLFDALVYDKDGKKRFTEGLTLSEEYKESLKSYSIMGLIALRAR
ncbi:DUF3944 domain-containing protein [Helicobacter pylori]|nr:DUF3944 domain-containing protein [Helicobacter pylori]